jgi:hypothetical protein
MKHTAEAEWRQHLLNMMRGMGTSSCQKAKAHACKPVSKEPQLKPYTGFPAANAHAQRISEVHTDCLRLQKCEW